MRGGPLRLFYHRNIYDVERMDAMFLKAMVQNIEHHRKNCGSYAKILDFYGFSTDEIASSEDLYKLPPLPTLFLKKHELSSMKKKMIFTSTTSGTSGAVS